MSTAKAKNIVIKGAKIKWARVHEPAQNYNKTGMEYSFDLEVSEKQLAALYKEGMSTMVKGRMDKAEGTMYITFKKPTLSAGGKEMLPIRVIGRNKEPFSELIGNGSVVNAVISVFPPTKAGYSACLRPEALQVVDHVEYSGGDNVEDLFEEMDADETDEFDGDFI
jgi:hypothetical protein